MIDAGVARPGRRAIVAVIVGLTMLFAAAAIGFATIQNVWIDESTQLLGSALPLGRMIAWLAGHPEPLGVPADRMPPLGYLVDWSWARIGGAAPFGYRLVHLAIASAGVAGLIALAARRYGMIAALVTGMLLVASPSLITVAVEIRAYPLFLAATVLQVWLLHRLFVDGVTWRRLIAFAGAGLVAVYIHFFGLVSASALFVGLVVTRARSRGEFARIGACWAATLALSAGILPFVSGARAISNDAAPENDAMAEAIAYLPRVYGHPAMLLSPVAATMLFLTLGGLLLLTAYRAVRTLPTRPLRDGASFEAALIVALVAGVVVTIGAGLVAHGFDPMKPSYSIWMVPLIALLAGAACAPGDRLARPAAGVALVAAVALLPIGVAFARHASWFVHGPERAIAAAIGPASRETAIVYTDGGWGYGYFPLVHRFGRGLPQYLLDAEGGLHPLTEADPQTATVPLASLARARQVLLVSIEAHTGDDLRALTDDADPALFAVPPERLAGWRQTESIVRPGLYWLRLARMERNRR